MNKPIDLRVYDTREEIIRLINERSLPITVVSMMLHEIINIVDSQLNNQIAKLREEYKGEDE